MASMRAVQLVAWGSAAELREVPIPEVGPGQVLLQVQGAGLCHSDLHLMDWPEGTLPYALPFTLGHEIAGRVAQVGAGVEGVREGEAMLVYAPWGCDRCWRCARGEVNLCENAAGRGGHSAGMGFHGGLADYVVVPSARYLVPIGDLDPAAAAPLADAALTPYHAIKRALPGLRPVGDVVVIGAGGLGQVAIRLLRLLTASRVIAIDVRDDALALAGAAGAAVCVNSARASTADIRAELDRRGASLVIDLVGIDQTLRLASALMGEGAQLTIVGVGGGTLPVASYESPPMGGSVYTPNWGTLPELLEVVDLARAGVLPMEVERVSLEAVPSTYGLLRAGAISGRAVAVPDALGAAA